MKKLFLATSAFTLLAGAAVAQEMPESQTGSSWYTDAQARIQEMLERQPNTGTATNVILFVADGQGVTTNYIARLFQGQQEGGYGDDYVQPQEAFPNLALVKTYNVNAQTPDSAPTAGSMNTGVKQVFNTINLNPEGAVHDDCATEAGNRLTTFAELMSAAGKSVGVVSTARITHATPAAVYAKTANRDWEDSAELPDECTDSKDIAAQLVDQMQAGVVDIALGGGRRHFLPTENGGRRDDGTDLVAAAQDAGVQYAADKASLDGLTLDGTTPTLGLFSSSHMSYEADRPDTEPSLEDLTRSAIEYLSNNEKGYYLEIEAGRVDHANHDGNAYRTVTDAQEFAQAIAAADALTDDANTLIIVTADHEHAIALNGYCGRGSPILGLCYKVKAGQIEHDSKPNIAADGKPYTVIGYLNGAGSILKEPTDGSNDWSGSRPEVTEEEATDKEYLQQALIPMSSETHSGVDVALYAKGPWAHLFDGTVEQNYIFHVMMKAVSGE